MFIRTKIVCTIGPSVNTREKLAALIDAGMNVARLNFSHGTHEEHKKVIQLLKELRAEKNIPLAIMLDTHGPKLRVGKIGEMKLVKGQRLVLGKDIPVEPEITLTPGASVLFDDGYIVGKAIDTKTVEIQNDGVLKSGKGINLPGAKVPLPALTESDIDDLRFGKEHDIDYVAGSFVRSSENVRSIKKHCQEDVFVIAKIESTEGVENFHEIMEAADGIMVARGDLGVEVDLALVPKLQKMMIREGYLAAKPVVTATQMLESMISNPRPTRAEVSDVANAIYDSTSCVMLSGETAAGKYPIETVQRMRSIVKEAESDFDYKAFFALNTIKQRHDISSAVSVAAVQTAYSVGAKCIFALTTSGQTARFVSRLRPEMPIIAVTTSLKHYHQLAFNWGVIPVFAPECKNSREGFEIASRYALSKNLLSKGDTVVTTSGAPFGKAGTTNMIVVEIIP